ncbi:MAG: mandelate racemase/muconate lactonizing enzyme family protein [Nitrospira sp.]|nr:mandelate racemase/muconate lactonizing enzyme family protein [Nitrospira sp.]
MKITQVRSALYRIPPLRPRKDAIQTFSAMELLLAEVSTDEGVTGVGYSYTIGQGGKAAKMILDEDLIPLILGEDSSNIERIWQKMWWGIHAVVGGISPVAIATIDIALWDLKAKRANLPLYKLLGGYRDQISVYNTEGGWLNMSLEEIKEEAVKAVEEGFPGIKLKVGKEDPLEDVKRVGEVRKLIGDSVKLMVDVNQRWTSTEAISRGKQLEEFNIFWLEEPLPHDDVSGHATLKAHLTVPIALGESLYTKQAFKAYLEQNAVSILQPDVGRVGGITEWMKIVALAEAWNLPVAPHFLMEIHFHLAAAIPHAMFVEYIPQLDPILEEPFKIKRGVFELPQVPGHGIRFDKDKLRAYQVN